MMSDPESTMIGINSPFGSLKLARVSVARAPKNEHLGGRARCFPSSIVDLPDPFSSVHTCNEVQLISLESFRRVLRLIEGGEECLTFEVFKVGASEYGFKRLVRQDSIFKQLWEDCVMFSPPSLDASFTTERASENPDFRLYFRRR